MYIPEWLRSLASVIYPARCQVCGCALTAGEHTICLRCYAEMPRTGIHKSPFNEIHHRTARTRIERAGAYFHYERHSPYAGLIHVAKYHDRPDIARELGAAYAREIKPDGFFDGIDIIEPVPLHWLRRIMRGYNQSYHIACGISSVTGIPLGEHLQVSRLQRSQTRRNAFGRHLAAEGLYRIKAPEELNGKHILVVDDVITTGATVKSCCDAIAGSCRHTTLSILSLGLSRKV